MCGMPLGSRWAQLVLRCCHLMPQFKCVCLQLYEEDAQIGADILGWKLTLTGVGACRQVTF
jgi:hypothetical protein